MTFEERFEQVMDEKAEVYAEETNDYYIIHGKRKSIYETYIAAVEDLKPIIIELRECLEFYGDLNNWHDEPKSVKNPNDMWGRENMWVIEPSKIKKDCGDNSRKTLARLDDFFGGKDEKKL